MNRRIILHCVIKSVYPYPKRKVLSYALIYVESVLDIENVKSDRGGLSVFMEVCMNIYVCNVKKFSL